MALTARDAGRLTALTGTLAHEGITASAHPGDLTDPASLTTALDGMGPVDVLVYNGGGTATALTSPSPPALRPPRRRWPKPTGVCTPTATATR
ncbi:hypothetical protein [Nonomuraea sp. NPDC049158]|uniref:hypothetical protein n=1 Tax=Nonomuraea sp. NPDC049158 TaxID=3155649 RepID=UPI0033DA2974